MSRTMRLVCFFAVLLSLPLLLAMSPGDSDGPTRIPDPDKAFNAVLTDIGGKTISLGQFSLEGQVYVLGNLGDGQVAVPFEKISRVDFANGENGLTATISLKTGERVVLQIRPQIKAFGKANFGFYRIDLGEVASLEVSPATP